MVSERKLIYNRKYRKLHVDPHTKKFNIGQTLTYSFSNIIKEIEKCNVLCKGCHSRLHRLMEGTK